MVEYIKKLNHLPTVTLGRHPWPYKDTHRVAIDVDESGRAGANYLISRGYKNLGFISWKEKDGNELPEYLSFYEETIKAGRKFCRIRNSHLIEDLKSAPKPLALMTYDDEWSVRIYNECEEAGINVPEEVAILGTANVKHLCEFNYVPLSSLDTKTDLCGYKAAQILDKLIAGQEKIPKITWVKPGEVIVRSSTALPPIGDIRVAKAVKKILENYRKSLDFTHLASEHEMCRWSLDEAFKKETGTTMSGYQLQCRMKEAEKLLKESDLHINEIGRHIGYINHVSFLRAFKRVHNCTPTEFRNASA